MTPYYSDGAVRIYHGDCREILPTLARADLMLTDPPYGINHPVNYKTRGRGKMAACTDYPAIAGDNRPFDPDFLIRFGYGAGAAMPTVLWGGNHYASRLPDSGGWLVWDKERPDDLDQATCELAWTNCVNGVRRFRYLWNGMMRAGNEKLVHPMQKPVALMKWCLSFVPKARTLVDPYCGSGPVLRAAKDLGLQADGIEIEERYCEIAAKRMSQEVFSFEETA